MREVPLRLLEAEAHAVVVPDEIEEHARLAVLREARELLLPAEEERAVVDLEAVSGRHGLSS
jgi:hypothetical protein